MSNPKVFGREMTALSECAFELGISMFTMRAEEQADGTVAAYIFLRGIGSVASKVFDAANPLEDACRWLEDEVSKMAREMAEIAIPQPWTITAKRAK